MLIKLLPCPGVDDRTADFGLTEDFGETPLPCCLIELGLLLDLLAVDLATDDLATVDLKPVDIWVDFIRPDLIPDAGLVAETLARGAWSLLKDCGPSFLNGKSGRTGKLTGD